VLVQRLRPRLVKRLACVPTTLGAVGIATIALLMLTVLVFATSSQAAETRVEGWSVVGLSEHFHLTFPLSRFWDQATMEQGDEAEEGPFTADIGAYVAVVGLGAETRCELRLEANATLTRHPPTFRNSRLEGLGVGQLTLSGNRRRRTLAVERSGVAGGWRWYLGAPARGRAAALAVEGAPAGRTPAGYHYLVAGYTIAWKTYREPFPEWHERATSAAQRGRCRGIALSRYRSTVLRALEQAQPANGHVLPSRPRGREAEPECVLRRCNVLAKDRDLVVYRARSRSLDELPYERTLVASLLRSTTTSLAGGLGPRLGHFVLSGSKLAFAEQVTGHYNDEATDWSIGRFDAATGSVERVAAALNGEAAIYYPHRVTDLVLDSAGAVAWIIEGPRTTPKVRSVYYLAPGSATPTQLGRSEAVRSGSLAILVGRLRWSEGGAAREAPIA
jgi:hypothetical protein